MLISCFSPEVRKWRDEEQVQNMHPTASPDGRHVCPDFTSSITRFTSCMAVSFRDFFIFPRVRKRKTEEEEQWGTDEED